MTKKELFLELAKPNEEGFSRWVKKSEFVTRYEQLNFNNGCPWIRTFGFLYETKTEDKLWMVRLIGKKVQSERPISPEIRNLICSQNSCHSGLRGTSNDYILPDHKNGRYNDVSVLNLESQLLDHFQPLTMRENLLKRQICKVCKNTNKRYDARNLGYSVPFIYGDEEYDDNVGCNGCYWFDCAKFKKSLSYGNQ